MSSLSNVFTQQAQRSRFNSQHLIKQGMLVQDDNPSIEEVEAGALDVQAYGPLHSELEACFRYVRP